MNVLLVNPPYYANRSRRGVGAQVPLGLIFVGGALLDDGHDVTLLDSEAQYLSIDEIVAHAIARRPQVVMTGHTGSTPAHPVTMQMCRAIKAALPESTIVYGGVYPSYHADEILRDEQACDVIVRGEGERTGVELVRAIERGSDLKAVDGISFRAEGHVVSNAPAAMIAHLDEYRAGWKLIKDWDLYQCWGLGRAAAIQLSRGCPHQCTYCGQRGFWTKWRFRNPELVAKEIATLHRECGVNFISLADENATTSKPVFESFLRALIAQGSPVKLFATIRATDIVRDADILHLYKQAGFECILMGMETTDAQTLKKIRKGSTARQDMEAVQLLRKHGILSMVGHVVGFEQERLRDYWNALRQLLLYDPDLLNAMYVTPHRWTPFYAQSLDRDIVEEDRSKWDYRHQVLGTRYMQPWQAFALVKAMEAIVHLRPRALARLLCYRDRAQRRAYRWCVTHSGSVWLHEIAEFFLRPVRSKRRPSLKKFWGDAFGVETALRSS